MSVIEPGERDLVEGLGKLLVSNPFLPERIELERAVLADSFVAADAAWNVHATSGAAHPNLDRLRSCVEALVRQVHERIDAGARPTEADLTGYEAMVLLLLYYRFRGGFDDAIVDAIRSPGACRPVAAYEEFEAQGQALLQYGALRLDHVIDELPLLFAICVQIRRAFMEVFTNIIGVSRPIVDLRAKVWQSVFTHDMQRYRRVLHRRGTDTTTLITGPSGTGKELVARAVALSQFIPFDARQRTFVANSASLFHPINLTALSPTLVESELFGHRRGSFTGAVADRAGWLEQCSPYGTVFLDEIGDLDPQIQVKLLRVLQARTFQPIGDHATLEFKGKIIAATNRDLVRAMSENRFRQDFFYRLCSDMITTPSLAEQIRDCPEQLHALVTYIAERLVGEEESHRLTAEVEQWIDERLGTEYEWPGNVRELEQCVRNVLVRRAYHPLPRPDRTQREALGAAVAAGDLDAEELLDRYCLLVYDDAGSYEGAAEKLGLDRRTVKKHVIAARERS